MTGQIVIRSSTPMTLHRRTRPLSGSPHAPPSETSTSTPTQPISTPKPSPNVGEVAGGTAAEVFVICCCCPCGMFKCLIMAGYKVPVIMLSKLWKTQRHKVMMIHKGRKKKVVSKEHAEVAGKGGGGVHYVGYTDELSDVELKEFEKVKVSIDGSAEAVELDRIMWDQFRGAGFWRSPSQRDLA